MELSINTRQAYSEIDELLELITEEEKKQIPKKLRDYFKEEKDKSYHKNINSDIPIKEQNLKEETLAIIALLNLQYWCKDENEKEKLKTIYAENEKKYQNKLRQKYNPENIFNNRKNEYNKENNNEDNSIGVQIVEYKGPTFNRIVNKILEILRIK